MPSTSTETFTELYCRLFRSFRAAMWAGYVPTPRERAVVRYLRARVARRPRAGAGSVSQRIHAAVARAQVRAERGPLASITEREIDAALGVLDAPCQLELSL